ncbi:hypothetical protein V6N12_050408 [Hibiscus sabdariffa]|uniref:RNase H type-1 domain-containing protein n=1 Tax=Hibiscus sabdariffa TaxID=183260 RepID=A0ABR2GCV9_9ROSI
MDYFMILFSTSGVAEGVYASHVLFLPLSAVDLVDLNRPVSDEEIKRVVLAMSPLKAPEVEGVECCYVWGVLRDAKGKWIMGFAKRINNCFILDSELWRIFEGLLLAWSLLIRCLMVETDSLEAYWLIMESAASSGGSTLLPYIVDLIARLWEIQVRHVCRGSNNLADRVAKLALEEDFLCHRYLDPPSSCYDVLLAEAALAEGGVDG